MLRAAAAIGLALHAAFAWAQALEVPNDLYRDYLRQAGDSIAVCFNADSAMADFEKALATELTSALLLEPRFVPVKPTRVTPPLDYRTPFTTDELFLIMTEECDAFMGFTLAASGYPEWMTITRPYIETRSVVVATSPDIHAWSDLKPGQAVGARMTSAADTQFLLYLQAQPETQRVKRHPYYDNRVVIDKLLDGTVSAALIWEPAIHRMEKLGVDLTGVHVLKDVPFSAPVTEIGIALRSKDDYLSQSLGQAIDALRADGTIGRLLVEHGFAVAS